MSNADERHSPDAPETGGWPGGTEGPDRRVGMGRGDRGPDEEAQNRNPGLARPADEVLFPGPEQQAAPDPGDPEGKVNTGQFRSDSDFEYHPGTRDAHGAAGLTPDGRRDAAD
jgi:hypothetical protein